MKTVDKSRSPWPEPQLEWSNNLKGNWNPAKAGPPNPQRWPPPLVTSPDLLKLLCHWHSPEMAGGVTQPRAWNKMLIRGAWLTHTTSYWVNQRRQRRLSPPKLSFPGGSSGKRVSSKFLDGKRRVLKLSRSAGNRWEKDIGRWLVLSPSSLDWEWRSSADNHSGQGEMGSKLVSETRSP